MEVTTTITLKMQTVESIISSNVFIHDYFRVKTWVKTLFVYRARGAKWNYSRENQQVRQNCGLQRLSAKTLLAICSLHKRQVSLTWNCQGNGTSWNDRRSCKSRSAAARFVYTNHTPHSTWLKQSVTYVMNLPACSNVAITHQQE